MKRTSDYVNSLTGKYDVLYEKGERAELELSAGQIMKFLGEVIPLHWVCFFFPVLIFEGVRRRD